MSNTNTTLGEVGMIAEDVVGMIPAVGQVNSLVKLAVDLSPLVLAGVVALVHKIHQHKNPVAATAKASAAVDATPNVAPINDIDPDGQGKDV